VRANVIVFEVTTVLLFIAFYEGARRAMGKRRARTFLLGAAAFALVIETVAVLTGLMNFYWYSTNIYYKSYVPTGYLFWLGVVPLAPVLLFAMVCAMSYLAAAWILAGRRLYARCLLAGGIAAVFYLMIEPIAVVNRWWVWQARSFYVLDFPLFAPIAVLLATFGFTLVFHYTIMERKDPKLVASLERKTVKKWPIKYREAATHTLNWHQLGLLFLFRAAAVLVAFFVAITPFIILFWAVANRAQVISNWLPK